MAEGEEALEASVAECSGDAMRNKRRELGVARAIEKTPHASLDTLAENLLRDLPFLTHVELIAPAQRTNRARVASFSQVLFPPHSTTLTCFAIVGRTDYFVGEKKARLGFWNACGGRAIRHWSKCPQSARTRECLRPSL